MNRIQILHKCTVGPHALFRSSTWARSCIVLHPRDHILKIGMYSTIVCHRQDSSQHLQYKIWLEWYSSIYMANSAIWSQPTSYQLQLRPKSFFRTFTWVIATEQGATTAVISLWKYVTITTSTSKPLSRAYHTSTCLSYMASWKFW